MIRFILDVVLAGKSLGTEGLTTTSDAHTAFQKSSALARSGYRPTQPASPERGGVHVRVPALREGAAAQARPRAAAAARDTRVHTSRPGTTPRRERAGEGAALARRGRWRTAPPRVPGAPGHARRTKRASREARGGASLSPVAQTLTRRHVVLVLLRGGEVF